MEWYRCGPRTDAVQCSNRRVRALDGRERRTVAGGERCTVAGGGLAIVSVAGVTRGWQVCRFIIGFVIANFY